MRRSIAVPKPARALAWVVLLGCGLTACRSPAAEERPTAGERLGRYLADYGDFASDPERLRDSVLSSRSLVPVALFAGAGALQIGGADARLQDRLSEGRQNNTWSDAGLWTLVGAAAVLPVVAPPREPAVKRWTFPATLLETALWTAGATEGVRALDLRTRPNGDPGSFFSGHTSHSFAAATLLDREYGPAVGIPAYVLASGVACDRVRGDHHFPADVMVGAGVGILIANLIYDKNFGKKGYFLRHASLQVEPVVTEQGAGLGLTIRW